MECESDGVCKRNVTTGVGQCECPSGFTGVRCEQGICDGYCSGNGNCTLHFLKKPMCECNKGYWGKQCQSDSCEEFCENGGKCTNNMDSMMCECPPHYKGDRCQVPVCPDGICKDEKNSDADASNPCGRVLCQNGGTCQVIRNKALCNCTASWHGASCQVCIGFTSKDQEFVQLIDIFV